MLQTAYFRRGKGIQWRAGPHRWLGADDHDALACTAILGLPLVPTGAVHRFEWTGKTSAAVVAIRRTRALTVEALARRYALIAIAVGSIGAIGAFPATYTGPISVAAAALALLARATPAPGARRDRDIRLVLGPHERGSADPALWLDPPREVVGEAAARAALAEGRFVDALRAARLAVGRAEEWGEQLTDEVLEAPAVRAILPELRTAPGRRAALLRAPTAATPATAECCARCKGDLVAAPPARFYDGRRYCASCLAEAGGPAFPAWFAANPTIERELPTGRRTSFALAALALAFAAGTTLLLPALTLEPRPVLARWTALLGVALVAHGLLDRRRTIFLGDGRLEIRRSTPLPTRSLPVRALRSVRDVGEPDLPADVKRGLLAAIEIMDTRGAALIETGPADE